MRTLRDNTYRAEANKTLKIPPSHKGWQHALTSPKIVKEIDGLLDNHSYAEIAMILNERDYKSGTGLPFNAKLIGSIRAHYDLKTRYARLRNTGKLTTTEIAHILGVTKGTIWKWKNKGLLKTYPYNDRNECLYEYPGVNPSLMKKRP